MPPLAPPLFSHFKNKILLGNQFMVGEEPQGERRQAFVTKRSGTSGRISQGVGEAAAPRDLPGRHPGRRDVRGLPCDASARAPDGTYSMWIRTPRAPRALCGGVPRERRGTGITPLSRSHLRSPAHEMGRIGGSGPSRPGSSQLGQANERGDHRRWGPTQSGAVVRMGSEQSGYGATTRWRFPRRCTATLHDRKIRATAVGRRTRAPER